MKNTKKMEVAILLSELEERLGRTVDRSGELGIIIDAHRVYRFRDESAFIGALYRAVEESDRRAALEALEQFALY